MPLIYGPTEMTNPQPKNFVTPSRTTGVYVQNVSPLALIITSSLGSIELPPWQTATLEMMPNDNMNVSAIPITAVPPTLAMYAYVDISYTFQGVTVQGSGLFFPFMTPGGDAVAAGIMGPDGLQVGTSTSNPNNSSLLMQLTGSLAPRPTLQQNVIGSYNATTFAFTPAGTPVTVAAGTAYNGSEFNVGGFENVSGFAVAATSSSSTSWKVEVTQSIPAYVTVASANGSVVTLAGANTSVVSGIPIVWPTVRLTVANSDSTNALELVGLIMWEE